MLFNMAVNPVSGKVYVTNTEARNDVRFEGHNAFGPTQGHPPARCAATSPRAASPSSIRRRRASRRATSTSTSTISKLTARPTPRTAKSLAFPPDMAVSPDGATLYVAALGSSKVGVFSTAELENDTFVPRTADQIPVTRRRPDRPRARRAATAGSTC